MNFYKKHYTCNAYIMLPIMILMISLVTLSFLFFDTPAAFNDNKELLQRTAFIFSLTALLGIYETFFRIKKLIIMNESLTIIGILGRKQIEKKVINKIEFESQSSRFGLFNKLLVIKTQDGKKYKIPGLYLKEFKKISFSLKELQYPTLD